MQKTLVICYLIKLLDHAAVTLEKLESLSADAQTSAQRETFSAEAKEAARFKNLLINSRKPEFQDKFIKLNLETKDEEFEQFLSQSRQKIIGLRESKEDRANCMHAVYVHNIKAVGYCVLKMLQTLKPKLQSFDKKADLHAESYLCDDSDQEAVMHDVSELENGGGLGCKA